MFDFNITERTHLDLKSSGKAGRADFLATKVCMVIRPIIDAKCAMSRASLARGGGGWMKWEGNILDRVATVWDGLLMLKIVLYR